jgi:hypothetical protein
MTAATLLESLKARGVTVASNGDRLKLAAPPGVLKPRVLDLARRHKDELLVLLQSDRLTADAVPPADGLQRRGGFIMPTRETLPSYAAHFDAKAASTNAETDGAKSTSANAEVDRQSERIRRLAADISPDELLVARRKIKPALQKSMSEIDCHELALTLAYADRREKPP